jgi:hypothetical protein
MKSCPKCNVDMPDAAAFCKICGGSLLPSNVVTRDPAHCPSCGIGVESDWSFCRDCASDLRSLQSASSNSMTTACPRCGATCRKGALFCKECGGKLGPQAAYTVAAGGPQVILPETVSANGTQFLSTPRARVTVGVGALIGVIILGWLLAGVKVKITTNPTDARIFLDDKEITRQVEDGGEAIIYAGRGKHALRVMRDGYDESSRTLDFGLTDFSEDINVALTPSVFTLTLITSPVECKVWLDSDEKGTTDRKEGKLVLNNIVRGKHQLRIQSEGYQEWTQTLSLESTQLIRVELKPFIVQSSSDQDEVRGFVEGWAATIRDKDLGAHMTYYADPLETYYKLTYVSSERVRDDRSRAFYKYTSLDVQVSNFDIWIDNDGMRATAIFDKSFYFQGEKNYSGAVQNRLTLIKVDGSWKITGEEELQVHYVNR